MNEIITIIIPTYNRPELLGRLLSNLRIQNREFNQKIIVVHDGEACHCNISDNSREMHICTNGQKGPATARNFGPKLSGFVFEQQKALSARDKKRNNLVVKRDISL